MQNNDILRIDHVLDKNLMGWLPVMDEQKKENELCYFTQIERQDNSEYFLVKEGPNKNKKFHINFLKINPRFFVNYELKVPNTHQKCRLYVSLKRQLLIFTSKNNELNEISLNVNNISAGTYKINLPIKIHDKRVLPSYLNEYKGGSRFAQSWFPIHNHVFEDRYIHFGKFSRGCVTVLNGQHDLWNELYLYLMKSRDDEADSLGELIIDSEN